MHIGFPSKIIWTLLCCVSAAAGADAQHTFHFREAPEILQASHYTYVYAIPVDSVYNIAYGYKPLSPSTPWMQQPAAIIPNDRIDSLLALTTTPAGYYLTVSALQSRMICSIRQKQGFRVYITDMERIKVLTICDSVNRGLRDISVRLGKRDLPYDTGMKGFVIKDFKDGDIITIRKDADIGFFRCASASSYNYKRPRSHNEAAESAQRMRHYNGYLVTNKPVYMPHDTVKWKAYLEQPFHKNKLVREPLRIMFSAQYDGEEPYKIATAYKPEEPGVYFGEFVLGDTVKMDRIYQLDLYGIHSALHMQQCFKTEDYLLDETHLRVTGENRDMYQPGDSINLYAFAYNSNNLPVPEGQLTITVTPSDYNTAPKQQIFIPDTLYSGSMAVNPEGETNIGFSTKAFPDAVRAFRCSVSLVNGNNEHADTAFTLSFTEEDRYINVQEEGRLLHAALISNKKPVSGKGSITTIYSTLHGVDVPISFPYDYKIGEEDQSVIFTLKDDTGKVLGSTTHIIGEAPLSGVENFHGDTAVLELDNPKGVRYRYSIYIGNDFEGYGSAGRDTVIKVYSAKGRTVSLIGTYMWKGVAQQQRFNVFKMDKDLDIELRRKELVFPGQRDTISIRLSNKEGNAIPRTNVTVLAFNNRFTEDFTPAMAYKGALRPAYVPRRNRSITPLSISYLPEHAATRAWLSRCGADTVFFYKNLYLLPDNIAWVTYDIPKSVQPQAGLYLQKGRTYYQPQVIYIDDRPAYIRRANSTAPEGFFMPEGLHRLRFRMEDAEYRIDTFFARAGMKTDMYLNIDSVGPFLWKEKMRRKKERMGLREDHLRRFISKKMLPDTLGYDEKDALAAALLLYRPERNVYSYPYGTAQFIQGAVQLKGIRNTDNYYSNSYGGQQMLFGPIDFRDSAGFYQQWNTKLRFLPERGYVFTFRPQMTRVEKASVYDYLHYRMRDNTDNAVWPSGNFVAPNPDTLDSLAVIPPNTIVIPDNNSFKDAALLDDRLSYGFRTTAPILPDTVATAGIRLSMPDDSAIRYVIYRKPAALGGVYIFRNEYGYPINVSPGIYQIMVCYRNGHYTLYDSVRLQAYGTTVFPISYRDEKGIYKFSKTPQWLLPYVKGDTLDDAGSPFYTASPSNGKVRTEAWNKTAPINVPYGATGIKGTLSDERGNPIVNANVEASEGGIIAGRTITDFDGNYAVWQLNAGRYTMKFSYLGKERAYTDISLATGQLVTVNARLHTTNELHGAVVSTSRYVLPVINPENPGGRTIRATALTERAATRNVSDIASLSTQVYQGGMGNGLSIGGSRSIDTRYIVDGVQLNRGNYNYNDGANNEQEEEAAGKPVLNGVLLNRRSNASKAFFNNFMANMMDASGLRRSFRDWAIWEPNLWTGSDGAASFTATYPDNLTSWKTYVLAMNRDGYSGKVLRLTRAFKPLSAQLSAPRFLRYGDTAEAIGKIANYTEEPFNLRSSFEQDGRRISGDTMIVHNTRVQMLQAIAPLANTTDTAQLTLTYSIAAGNGYTDGEERILPVLPSGVTESKGLFVYLDCDTSIISSPDTAAGHFSGRTRISVDGSLLEVMLREVEHLKEYPHGCNEQLTTKLLAIYYEEAIKKLLGKTNFNNTAAKKQILEQLIRSQRPDGGFSWWYSKEADYRITNYIISTMQQVNSDGQLNMIIRRGMSFLDAHLTDMLPDYQIASLQTLSAGGYAANFKPLLDKLDSAHINSLYSKLAIIKIRKEQGLPYRAALDTFMKQRHETMNGFYWAGTLYDWYRDDLATTLLAYSVIKGDSIYRKLAPAVARYILFQRQNGYYGSTASSGLVLTTLLPDIISRKALSGRKEPTYLRISGSLQDSVIAFPKKYTIREAHPQFSFVKQGISPVYLSVAYDYFNVKPAAHNAGFTVHTYFLNAHRDTVTALKAGERITLRTTVKCSKEAEYVMIDIPIPAGAIQVDKHAYYHYAEAAREHFKDQTDIFCDKLSEGTEYTFDIIIEARFKGSYSVSPARAGMMYYPEEYGNTGVRRIQIK